MNQQQVLVFLFHPRRLCPQRLLLERCDGLPCLTLHLVLARDKPSLSAAVFSECVDNFEDYLQEERIIQKGFAPTNQANVTPAVGPRVGVSTVLTVLSYQTCVLRPPDF